MNKNYLINYYDKDFGKQLFSQLLQQKRAVNNSASRALAAMFLGGLVLFAGPVSAQDRVDATGSEPVQRQTEKLNRGIVAVQQANGKVFISWRLLKTDEKEVAFNIF